jgi:ABC-type antimicrobial peptide transport system permease subunit
MIKNYLTIALRSLKRNAGFTLINIVGLASGLAVAILVLLWVFDETSFDRFHKNLDEIYRVYEHQTYSGTDGRNVYYTPGPLAKEIREKFPNIKRVARLTPISRRVFFIHNEEITYDNDGYFGDQDALDIFTFDFIYGSSINALTDPNSIILTKEKAESLFGNQNPVGESLLINSKFTYTVRGVINKPRNTHLNFSFIIPFDVNREKYGQSSVWSDMNCFTYIEIDKTYNYLEIENQLANVTVEHGIKNTSLHLEPLKRSYLFGITGMGAIKNVRIFSAVAILVLIIACINFINLSTAWSARRAKEVCLRKVAGCNRLQLIGQFLGESVLLSFISLIIAVGLVLLLLPSFNYISGKSFTIHDVSPIILLYILLITLSTGIVSGSYPAFFLSSFNPIRVIKGKSSEGSKVFRTVLVIFQFTLSVVLIISTLIVNRQLEYMINKNLGFQKDNIVVLGLNAGGRNKFAVLKDELIKLSGVEQVTMSSGLPNQIGTSTDGVTWVGKDVNDNTSFHLISVFEGFIDVFGMELTAGRAWNSRFASDSAAVIINEEAAKTISAKNPVGQFIQLWGVNYEIIGVIKNFNFDNLKQEVKPLLMFTSIPWQNNVCIKLNPDKKSHIMKEIEGIWGKVYPGQPFRYSFFDQEFENIYLSEMRMMKLFTLFSFLTILISCLGLFGLATFMAEQKSREIAIRKTLGATEFTIVQQMVWEFIKWVLIANLTGWFLAFYAMDKWLRSYAYRITIKPDVFITAGLISIIIAFLTVSYKVFRASRTNPAKALKYE